MWAKRGRKLGEKITSSQSTATKRPSGAMAWPVGDCIQLLAEMIQKAEISVPIATIQVATKWSLGPTFFQPNSMTPRKLASRKKAVSTSKANSGPITGEAAAEKTLQLVPSW